LVTGAAHGSIDPWADSFCGRRSGGQPCPLRCGLEGFIADEAIEAHQLLAWCPSNEGARSPGSIGVVETSIAEDGTHWLAKIHVQLIDDISGENAQETLRFSLDGVEYEIDLAEENAAGLRATLAPFIAHGRRVRGVSGNRTGSTAPTSRQETQKIREWAMANGYDPSSRGASARTSGKPTTARTNHFTLPAG
jgi:hypothetical protein